MLEASPSQLATRCQNAQPNGSHEPYCFELFRRAILEGCSLCWQYLYNHYYILVRYWIRRHTSFEPDAPDDLVQDVLARFWRFYTPDKLARANQLADILAYLKSCAASAVAQVGRRAGKLPQEVEWESQIVDNVAYARSAESSALENIDSQQLWAAIQVCCNNEQEQLIARLLFLAGLRPRHIADRHPDLFPDVSDVYRIKRNLLDRLRRDPVLRKMRKNNVRLGRSV